MSDVQVEGRNETTNQLEGIRSIPVRILIAIRQSFVVFVAALGVVFLSLSLILSAQIPGVTNGTLSAMAFIWSISAFLYAGIGFVILKLIGYS